MKSFEERLAIAESELRKRGVKNFTALIESGRIEEPVKPTNVKKNNGVADRLLSEAQSTGVRNTTKQDLFETCKRAGMSEAEARIFAGIEDSQITEAVDKKLGAGDFWSRLTEEVGR